MMSSLVAAWVSLTVLLPCQDPKSPVPAPAAQKEAEKLIRDVFKDEYARRLPAEKAALAKKLLQEAVRSKDDPVSRYVLLREARELASSVGEIDLALGAVDEMSKGFEGEAVTARSALLAALAKGAKTPEEFQKLAKGYLVLADEALAADQPDAAQKAAEQASLLAKKGKEMPLLAKADGKVREIAEARSALEKAAKAKEALARNPEDPAASLAWGQHLAFQKGDWENGLRFLSKGSDATLKDLALRDLRGPSTGPDQVALGDGWWDLGEKESGPSRNALRKRGAFWYGQAFAGLSGLHKARIEKRLKDVGASSPVASGEVDLLARIDPRTDFLKGDWQATGGKLVAPLVTTGVFSACTIPCVPPKEYDLTVVAERRSGRSSLLVGLVGGGRQFDLELDGAEGRFSGLDRIDGKWALENETRFRGGIFAVGVQHTVLVRVRSDRVIVLLDGAEVVSWAADYRRVSPHPLITLKNTDSLFLGSWASEFLIHRMTLKPATEPAAEK